MKYKDWTDEQIALLKDLYPRANVSTEHLQQLLGRSQQALHHKALALGLRRPSTAWAQHHIDLLKQMYPDHTVSAEDMEKTFSRSWVAIKIKANKLGLLRPERNKYEVNRHYFQIIDSSIKAYLLGLLAADGAIDYKKCQYRVTLMLQFRDKLLINRLKDEIAPNIPVTINRKTYSISISSKEMCEDLATYGIGSRKSANLSWPNTLPEQFAMPFILGYFDGDGTLYRVNSREKTYWRWELLGCYDFLAMTKQQIERSALVKLNGPICPDSKRSPHLYRIYIGSQQGI